MIAVPVALFFPPSVMNTTVMTCVMVHVPASLKDRFLGDELLVCYYSFNRITSVERYCPILNTIRCSYLWNRPHVQAGTHNQVILNKQCNLQSSIDSIIPFIFFKKGWILFVWKSISIFRVLIYTLKISRMMPNKLKD